MKRSLLLLLALGACVAPSRHVSPPIVQPRPAPPPVVVAPPVAWEDRARTPGNWEYFREGERSGAIFSSPDGRVSFDCGSGSISISRDGLPGGAMTIRTTTVSRTLQTDLAGHPPIGVAAKLAASDPLLDAIIFSRGKFMLAVSGQPDLILPPWPEIARVVEDCRR